MRTLEKILEEYLSTCIKHGESLAKGDSKTANKQFRILNKIRTDLKNNKEYGLESLLPFLEHENESVRLHTAAIVIPVAPLESKKVLEALSDGRGTVSFSAEMTLTEWQKGNLEFD